MYSLSLKASKRTDFSKHATMTEAKERADFELENDSNNSWETATFGNYLYAEIYNQTDGTKIRKNRGQTGWMNV